MLVTVFPMFHQVFYNVLLQYFARVAGEKSLSIQRLNVVVKPLIELSGETPYFAALCARERIVQMQHQLSEKLRSTGQVQHVLEFCDFR
jgi:nucleolar protein 14